jgi:hypothetical protein
MMPTLFEDASEYLPLNEDLGPGTAILRGFARTVEMSIMEALFIAANVSRSRRRAVSTPVSTPVSDNSVIHAKDLCRAQVGSSIDPASDLVLDGPDLGHDIGSKHSWSQV